MSQENVEIVQASFDVWNAGDMDACRELHDPDVILRPEKDWPEPGPYIGREAVFVWHPVGSHGPDPNMQATIVYSVRDGKIREVEFFWDHAEALDAVGLRE